MRIQQLNEHLTNMIAAGEVVERPMGIVKECVENSIDAHADAIEVHIKDGGLECITIIDNGIGMDYEDAKMAFERHATSKIKKDDDLWNIHTLGFRGEALPSIASVAAVDLKTNDGKDSTLVQVHYGQSLSHKTFATPKGTQIDIQYLFQKTPARFKHLKTPQYEFSLISDVIQKFSLAYPNIAFRLVHNDVETFKTNGNGHLQEVLMQIYGRDIAKNAIAIHGEDEDYKIEGYAVQPTYHRATKYYMLIYINQRMVRSVHLQKAILDAYSPYLPSDRYPIVVLNILMDAQLVDVNVHPSKWEIRLSKEKQCEKLIYTTLSNALKTKLEVNEIKPVKEKVKLEMPVFNFNETEMTKLHKEVDDSFLMKEVDSLSTYEAPVILPFEAKKVSKVICEAEITQPDSVDEEVIEPKREVKEAVMIKNDSFMESQKELVEEVKKVNESLPDLSVIGQFHNCYILAQGEKGLYIIDQHAAQEKYHYEQLKHHLFDQEIAMQPLLIPEILKIPQSAIAQLDDLNSMLKSVHIQLELFGNDQVIIRETPLWLKEYNLQGFINDLVDFFLKNNEINIEQLRKSALASLACHSSIRFNRSLSLDEMRQVIEDLKKCEQPFHCPHGRPTLICISDAQLVKDFYRGG